MPWLLRRVNQRYRASIARALDEAGLGELPQPGYWALMALASGVREAGQLVTTMGVTKQAVSKLVDRLVSTGFVERHANPADRRRTELLLTAKGRNAVGVIDGAVRVTEEAFVTELGAKPFAELASMLEQLTGGET